MNKLEDIRKRGFVDSKEIDVTLIHNNWNYNKLKVALPRNTEKVMALLLTEGSKVPFTRFSTWLTLYKGLTPSEVLPEDLDLYFEEYRIYYEAKGEDNKVINISCEYSIHEVIDAELKRVVEPDADVDIVKNVDKIDIGEVSPVNIDYAYKISMQCADALLKG